MSTRADMDAAIRLAALEHRKAGQTAAQGIASFLATEKGSQMYERHHAATAGNSDADQRVQKAIAARGGADHLLMMAAKERQKREPKLTLAQAMAAVLSDDPKAQALYNDAYGVKA